MQIPNLSYWSRIAVVSISGLIASIAGNAEVTDIPAGHWAAANVKEIVAKGIMTAPNGKFEGAKPLTRRESALVLTRFAKSLLSRSWKSEFGHSMKDRKTPPNLSRPLTRYEAAVILTHFGRYAMKGLPDTKGKVFANSKAMPKQPSLDTVPKSDPVRSSLEWLSKKIMLHPGTVLVAAKDGPVTGQEFAEDLSTVLIGAVNQLADEPELRAQIDPPPAKGGK